MPSLVRMLIRSASNSATMANTLNNNLPIGSVGSWIGPPRLSLDLALGEFVEDVPGVWQGPGQPVQFGHHERVTAVAGGKGEPQTWSVTVRAGQAVIDVDPVIADAERGKTVALRGQILMLCGHPRVPTRS